MAWWGLALSAWGNPFAAGIKPAAQIQRGLDAVTRARSTGAPSARESRYIEAVARLYEHADSVEQRARLLSYRDAMAELAAAEPADTEAAIFHALALAISADPADKTYASQLAAGATLERLFAGLPDHPGLAHYIIHSYDVPPLAGRALDAARRYSRIAPAISHALHMPSHTYTRVGYWQQSIDANVASAEAARREGATAEELHASDYRTYAYLQMGQDRAVRRILAALPAIAGRLDPNAIGTAAPPAAGYFAIAAIPARYALERGAWAEAARLELRPSPVPFADAVTWFARGLGAARIGDTTAAQTAIAALLGIRERLVQARDTYWSEEVGIQQRVVVAWLAFAAGRKAEALADMRAAAEREDATTAPDPHASALGVSRTARFPIVRTRTTSTRPAREEPATVGRYGAVASGARSDPAPGSENSWHQISLGVKIRSSHRCFCSTVQPNNNVGTGEVDAHPVHGLQRAETAYSMLPAFRPGLPRRAMFAGQWMPTQRSAASFACHSRPHAISSSSDSKAGATSKLSASHARISAANASSAGVKLRSTSEIPKSVAVVLGERGAELGLVGRGERPVRRLVPTAHEYGVTVHAITAPLLVDQRARHDLEGAGRGRLRDRPHVPRSPFGSDVGLRVEPQGEPERIELDAIAEHQPRHDLVARLVVGHAVDRGEHNIGMESDGFLDRTRGEVLTVDADPIGLPAREVEVPVGVDVAEVAGPVPAVAGGLLGGRRVVVVALERTDAGRVDDLADGRLGIDQATVVVELRAWLLDAVVVHHLHVRRDEPERARALLRVAVHRDSTLGRAVRVDDLDAEAPREPVDHLRRPFVAERDPQSVVGIVRRSGCARRYASGLPV